MILKKIGALFLCAIMLLSALASCSKTPDSMIEKANKKLERKPYVMEVDLDFSSDDEVMSLIFEQLGRNETKVYVKDGRIRAVNEQYIDYGDGDDGFITSYTFIDGVLYHEITHVSGIASRTVKNKGEFSSDRMRSVLMELCIFGGLTKDMFSDVSEAKNEDERLIVCKDATSEAKFILESAIVNLLDAEGVIKTVKANDIRYVIAVEGGKYESMTVVCDYTVTIGESTAAVRMEAEIEFDYDERFSIEIPDDVFDYTDADMNEIIN